MAKRRRRSKAGPSNSSESSAGRAGGLNGVEDLRGELETLKEQLSSAKAQAAEREQSPPQRSRRGLAIAAGAVTVGAGVAAGVLLSDRGGHSRLAAPITAAPTTPKSGSVKSPGSASPSASTTPAQPAPALPAQPAPALPAPAPAPAPVPPSPAAPPAGQIVVARGGSFWSIAQSAEAQLLGRAPSTAEIARYWLVLIDANRSRLINPGDPNLIYAGQTVLLPPI